MIITATFPSAPTSDRKKKIDDDSASEDFQLTAKKVRSQPSEDGSPRLAYDAFLAVQELKEEKEDADESTFGGNVVAFANYKRKSNNSQEETNVSPPPPLKIA